jgi:hypothetical protein
VETASPPKRDSIFTPLKANIQGWKAGFMAFHAFHIPAFPWLFFGEIAFLRSARFRRMRIRSELAYPDRMVQTVGSGCSERLNVLPSGSLNQATFAPVGEVQMPDSS